MLGHHSSKSIHVLGSHLAHGHCWTSTVGFLFNRVSKSCRQQGELVLL